MIPRCLPQSWGGVLGYFSYLTIGRYVYYERSKFFQTLFQAHSVFIGHDGDCAPCTGGLAQSLVLQEKGLSFASSPRAPDKITGIAHVGCFGSDDGHNKCNPYQGDMVCGIRLPVLCFKDIKALAPKGLANTEYWSGGVIATTVPIAASSFKKIADVNKYCAAQFGGGWRVANFHDGGGWELKAYGNVGNTKKRVWVDIKNQKKGTCWSR